jgi:hypothetical protein
MDLFFQTTLTGLAVAAILARPYIPFTIGRMLQKLTKVTSVSVYRFNRPCGFYY